jgi:hypothetical protein
MEKRGDYPSENPPPPYERNRPEKKGKLRAWVRERKVRILKTSCYATQILASALIVLAWASDGKDWAYVDVDGFSMGGRGYCNG